MSKKIKFVVSLAKVNAQYLLNGKGSPDKILNDLLCGLREIDEEGRMSTVPGDVNARNLCRYTQEIIHLLRQLESAEKALVEKDEALDAYREKYGVVEKDGKDGKEEEYEQECTCVNCVFDGIRCGETPCVSCVHGCLDEDAPNHFEKKWW